MIGKIREATEHTVSIITKTTVLATTDIRTSRIAAIERATIGMAMVEMPRAAVEEKTVTATVAPEHPTRTTPIGITVTTTTEDMNVTVVTRITTVNATRVATVQARTLNLSMTTPIQAASRRETEVLPCSLWDTALYGGRTNTCRTIGSEISTFHFPISM